MTATTDHYVGIDLHKREAQVAVLDSEDEIVEMVRVANADPNEIAQKYAGSSAALETGSNYSTIYNRLDEESDVILAIPAQADWLEHALLNARQRRVWVDCSQFRGVRDRIHGVRRCNSYH